MLEQTATRTELSAPPSIELTQPQVDLLRQYLPPHVFLVFDALTGATPDNLARHTGWAILAIEQYKKKNGLEGKANDELARVVDSLNDPGFRQKIIERIVVPRVSVILLGLNRSGGENDKLQREIISDLELVVETLVKNPEYFK